MKLLIIHISDIHLREGYKNPGIAKFAHVGSALQNEEANLDYVVVVVSGDIAYGGSRQEYDLAKNCLDTLAADLEKRIKMKALRFVFVPGNHDCDFSGNNSVRTLTIDAVRTGTLPDEEMINCCCQPQNKFLKFRDEYTTGKPHRENSPLHWEYEINENGMSILFLCYNTAWMSMRKEVQGSLHMPDVVKERANTEENHSYIISVFHHPYNWMPSATFRKFKGLVEEASDLILTGHEHEADHYQKYSFKSKETNDYLEGAVFQEGDSTDRSGFHAIYVDLSIQKQKIISFNWENDRFIPEGDSQWTQYKRGSRGGKKDFELGEEMMKWLEDPGASYQHAAKPDLHLSDIYVFPNLKHFEIGKKSEFIYGALIEGRDLLKTLGAKQKVLVFGRQQSGKTTLIKILFADFHNKNFTPVVIHGDTLTKSHLNSDQLDKLVEYQFGKQYANQNLPAFKQLDKDRSVLIIDDFDHAALNAAGRLRLLEVASKRYERIIVFADDIIKIEELAVHNDGGEVLADFTQFEIVQFGHLLKSKLITKWYSIGSEYDTDQEELAKRIYIAEQMVSTMLGKNYLPHFPVFILTLIQASDSVTRPNSSAGTYGSLYEVIITQSLVSKGSKVDLDTKVTYLSEIAHWMHVERKKRITDEEWDYFHQIYCKKFKIKPSREALKKDLAVNGIFDIRDECFGFRHPASYYYFVARFLRDNLAQQPVRDAVTSLLDKLYKEEHASIWLFLTHLSKDPFLLDTILAHSRKIYSELQPARFQNDVEFLQDLSKNVETIVLKDATIGELKEEKLRDLDERPVLVHANEDFDIAEEETNETLKNLARMNLSLRTLEVLGQLVKNFPGSLQGDDKLALVEECYLLGLRTVSMLFGLVKDDINNFVDFVYDRILDKHPDIKDKDELKTKVRKYMFWMIESSCFSMIKRISHAVGHSQLGEIYSEVRQRDGSNATALIDIAIRLENLGFPEDRLKELAKRFGPQLPSVAARPKSDGKSPMPASIGSNNVFCERILKQLVVEHFYLFPTRETTKQKVCAALNIEISGLRQIDVEAEHQRRSPQSALPSPN